MPLFKFVAPKFEMVVWYGLHGYWPDYMLKQAGTNHKTFAYLEKPPEELIKGYFDPDNQVKRIINMYRRVMANAKDTDGCEDSVIPFTVPG
jgi:hypothetical protein